MGEAHDLLIELVEVVKEIPAEFTCDFDDLGDRIRAYLDSSLGEWEPKVRGESVEADWDAFISYLRWREKEAE